MSLARIKREGCPGATQRVNEATLQALREMEPLAGLLSQYRQWAKLVGTYGIAWLI